MMDARINDGWANRLSTTTRITLIVVTAVLGLLAIALLARFSYAFVEEPDLPSNPAAYMAFAVMLALVALFGWLFATLVRSIRPETMSGFDRRYWKMWAVMAALGLPLGIGIAVLGIQEDASFTSMVLSNSAIAPLTAILGSILLTAFLIVSLVIYFRAIDDHEERAYLWGSNVAFHFVAIAFPLYWLLARGSLVPTLTIGIALLIILFSCIVQAIVWALFKFR